MRLKLKQPSAGARDTSTLILRPEQQNVKIIIKITLSAQIGFSNDFIG